MEVIIEVAANFIANALLQVSALLLIALVCTRLILRTAPARRQYLFWVGVLILSVVLPVFSLFTFRDNSKLVVHLPFENNQANIEKSPGTVDATDEAFSTETKEQASAFDVSIILQVIAICYFLFLSYRLFHFLKTWRHTMQLRHSIKNEKLSPLFDSVNQRCCAVLEINAVPIFFSAETASPLTLGAKEPIIILPESFTGITSEKTLTAILGHELAHIRRRDYAWNLVFEFLSLPVLFHPAVTFVKRNIHQTREMACDELVSESLLKPLDYARSLVQIAGFITPSSQTAYTLGVFNADILEKRIMKLIETSRGAYRHAGKIRFLFAVTLLGLTATVTSVFSLALPFNQKQENEKVTIPKPDSTLQDNDPKIVNLGVMNSKAVKLPIPEYPDEAKRANIGGSITVQVIVDEEGNVASAKTIPVVIKVIRRDGTETIVDTEELAARKILSESAETAAKQAKFAPTILSGKPVRVKGIIVYNFGAGKEIDRTSNSGEVLNGKATSLPVPEYPSAAKAVRAAGAVYVKVVIDEEGNVTSAEAISGHPLLRTATVNAAKAAKFAPTILNGQAVKVSGVLVYNFSSAADESAEVNEESANIKGGAAEDASVEPLKILSKPIPQYTDEARKNGVTGTIKLRVTFLASGSIGDISPENTLPDGLTEVAIEAVKGIKFKPATKNGEPLTVTKLVEYSFTSF